MINKHCVQCHSATPTFVGIGAPPGGFVLDTNKQIRDARKLIIERAVLTNITKMTKEERAALAAWASE